MSRREEEPRVVGGWVLAREAVRGVDRLAVERYGLPSVVLMENAALGLAARAGAMLDELGTGRVVILAGPGNNGGDGFALARHLVNAGREVLVFAAGDPGRYAGDAATNLGVIRQMGLAIERLDRSSGAEALEYAGVAQVLIVDALLGTGLREAARGVIGDVILQVNRMRQPGVSVLAVDVPSGLDCDTGAPAGGGPAVEADATVTFVALKPGFLTLRSQRWTGEVSVAGIGVPRELVEELGEFVADTRPGAREPDGPGEAPTPPPSSHGRADARPGGRVG
jgi:NAD(P)H-hydrate epimerase